MSKKTFELNGELWEADATEADLAHVEKQFAELRTIAAERKEAAAKARPALERLCAVLCDRSGQPYKVREILFGLWNGKPCQIIELLNLDWEIRKDLCAVLLGFGWGNANEEFFYRAIQEAVTKAGQWDWFIEESNNLERLKEYVKHENVFTCP